jgi:hypothetical protein
MEQHKLQVLKNIWTEEGKHGRKKFKILLNEEFDDLKAYRSYKVEFEVLKTVHKISILWGYEAK